MIPGLPRPDAKAVYRQVELVEALNTVYTTDAHFVQYIATGVPDGMQHRLRKDWAHEYPHGPVMVNTLLVDVDNPGHAVWTPELLRDAEETWARLTTAGIYTTRSGYRIVQPLAEPVLYSDAESYLKALWFQHSELGISVDTSCIDWTRHMRAPHVKRDGLPFVSTLRLDRMQPITLIPVATPELTHRARKARVTGPRVALDYRQRPPPSWAESIRRIAAAIVTHEPGAWHDTFLAMAGDLVSRGVVPEAVPAIAVAISDATALDTARHDRYKAACTTIDRWANGYPIKTLTNSSWPVREAVLEATAVGTAAQIYEARRAAVSAPPVDLQAQAVQVEHAIATARDGVTIIVAACGLGKTRAAERVAQNRDEVDHNSRMNVRTSLLVPTNRLAVQCASHLPRALRKYGALSVEPGDPHHQPCKYRDVALPLVQGGQSLTWNFCLGRGHQKCDVFDACTAKHAAEGLEDARITIATHAKTDEVAGGAGTTELVIIDEPTSVLHHPSFTAQDFTNAEAHFRDFESSYIEAIEPAFRALQAWHGGDAQPERVNVADVFQPGKRGGTSPAMRYEAIRSARWLSREARERLGEASELLDAVYEFYASPRSVARYDTHKAASRLVLVYPNMSLVRALRREGRTILLDANGLINEPIYQQILGEGREPEVHYFDAPDGAPVDRTLLRVQGATRSGWTRFDALVVNDHLVRCVRAMVDWILLAPATVVSIITMGVVERHLAAAWGEPSDLPSAAFARLVPELNRLRDDPDRQILWGHYGALRGLDHMMGSDAIVTLGDPWQNVGDIQAYVDFLDTADVQTADQRSELLCRAELEQAHGRLRTIHRTRPGRACHIGAVLPSGSGWGAFTTRSLDVPTGHTERATYDAATLGSTIDRLGGVSVVSAQIGLTSQMLSLVLSQKRLLSSEHYNHIMLLDSLLETSINVTGAPTTRIG